MKDLTHVLLGVPTVFGDSDVAQTHIMVMSLFLGFLSVAGVIYTLLLQQATLKSQIWLSELQTKVHLKTLLPKISLDTEITKDIKDFWEARIDLIIENNDAIIYHYGFKEKSNLISIDEDLFLSKNLPMNVGRYELKNISVNTNETFIYKNKVWKNIPENKRSEAILEITYGDIYKGNKVYCEFYFDMTIHGPSIKLIKVDEN